jgi:DNA-binding transcriptional regulator YiaG
MRSYEALCIERPKEISPNNIRELRLRLGMSKCVFAKPIGASPSIVEKWSLE